MRRLEGELEMPSAGALIKEFTAMPLFEHVGEPLDDDRVEAARSWSDAIKRRCRGSGSELGDAMMNRLHAFVRKERGEDWYNKNWSKLIDGLKKKVRKLEPRLERLLDGVKHGDIVVAHAQMDVVEACLIAEFPEPECNVWVDWFQSWYESGHFPAGYVGKLPPENHPDPDRLPRLYQDGKLFVY